MNIYSTAHNRLVNTNYITKLMCFGSLKHNTLCIHDILKKNERMFLHATNDGLTINY